MKAKKKIETLKDWAKDLPEFTLPPELKDWDKPIDFTLPPDLLDWEDLPLLREIKAGKLKTQINEKESKRSS